MRPRCGTETRVVVVWIRDAENRACLHHVSDEQRSKVWGIGLRNAVPGNNELFRLWSSNMNFSANWRMVKILPTAVAADHDRLARFQREAEEVASLNHPHIAAFHGFEERGGITALVMELDGQ